MVVASQGDLQPLGWMLSQLFLVVPGNDLQGKTTLFFSWFGVHDNPFALQDVSPLPPSGVMSPLLPPRKRAFTLHCMTRAKGLWLRKEVAMETED